MLKRKATTFDIRIEGDDFVVESPEGKKAMAPIADVLAEDGDCDVLRLNDGLPDGLRYARRCGGVNIWVHETTPRIWNLKWIAPDSQRGFGGADYVNIPVSLPYIVTIGVFAPGLGGRTAITHLNECFFRNEPLRQFDKDELFVPGLLNCSVYQSPHEHMPIGADGRPVVWICTQYLDAFRAAAPGRGGMTHAFRMLYHTLMETGFNYSSDAHEFSSGFTESTGLILDAAARTLGEKPKHNGDVRAAAIDAWRRATAKDPEFALSVSWLPTGYTVAGVVGRIFRHANAAHTGVRKAADIARAVFRLSQRNQPRRKRQPTEPDPTLPF